jgi:gluconolactonase
MRNLAFLLLAALVTFPCVPQAQRTAPVVISNWEAVYQLDPRFEEIVPPDVKVERIAQGLGYVEGPVWDRRGGFLVFSDMRNNAIYKWDPNEGRVSVLLDRAGFAGADPTGVGSESRVGTEVYYTIGPNGVTLDPQGRVVFCAVGDRQIVRLEADGRRTVLASHYDGKRFGGPNDLVIKANGALYFTDTYSGLRGREKNPDKELRFSGVYLLKAGQVHLLLKDRAPNGLALNPSQTHLYVNDSPTHTIWRYEIRPDNTLGVGAPLVTLNAPRGPGGIKFDAKENIYASVAGAVWILSPQGEHLGSIVFPQYISNIGFGDADRKTLYATGRTEIYRIRLKISGIVP